VEPGARGGAPLERLAPPPGPQQRLLHHVLSVAVRAEHAITVDLQLMPVTPRQLGEPLPVIRPDRLRHLVHSPLPSSREQTYATAPTIQPPGPPPSRRSPAARPSSREAT